MLSSVQNILRPVLVDGVDDRLKELIKETCDQLNVEIIEMEIMPDHVHLLMEVDPNMVFTKQLKESKVTLPEC